MSGEKVNLTKTPLDLHLDLPYYNSLKWRNSSFHEEKSIQAPRIGKRETLKWDKILQNKTSRNKKVDNFDSFSSLPTIDQMMIPEKYLPIGN